MNGTLTVSALADYFATLKGAQPISISALTKADCKLPDGREVWKLAKVYSFNRADYRKAVQRRLDAQAALAGTVAEPFTPKPRKWGSFVQGSRYLVEHKGQHYLALQVMRAAKPVYFTRDAGGFLRYLKNEVVAPLLPVRADEGAAQGLEQPITCRDYKLDNLVSVNVAGKRLRVERSQAQST